MSAEVTGGSGAGGSLLRPLQLYARPAGRSGRREYWSFSLAAWAFEAMLLTLIPPLGIIAAFLLLPPLLSVAVRRLHDGDRRGWWLLPLPLLVPPFVLLLGLTQFMLGDETGRGIFIGLGVLLAAMLVHGLLLIVLLSRRGTTGPNRFGPDPSSKERPARQVERA